MQADFPVTSGAFEEALRLRHGFAGDMHVLLSLVRPGRDTAASRALAACGVDYDGLTAAITDVLARSDPPLEPADYAAGISLSPAAHQLLGRAEGLAAGLGADAVQAEHVLLAYLWSPNGGWPLERCGTTREAVLDRLRAEGVPVPAAALPPERKAQGDRRRVYFPQERLHDVLAALPERMPAGADWGWNLEGDFRAWVSASGDVDLDALVREALSVRPD